MLLFETPHWHWTAHFAAALAWNTLVMSIFGMAIYNLMLDRHGAGRASSGFFVVPGASAVMGFLLLNEHLSAMTIAGLAASTVGVVLVWWRPARKTDGCSCGRSGQAACRCSPVRTELFGRLLGYLADLATTEDDHDVR